MLEEPVILGGEDGLDEVLRHGRERDGMPELVGGLAEAGERLGLELDLLQRLAGGRDQLANPAAVKERAGPGGPAASPGIVARPEVELPEGRLAAELARRRRRRLGLTVPEAAEGAGEIDGLDRDSGGEDLARGVDEGGVLQPREVDGRPRSARSRSRRRPEGRG